MFKGKLTVVLSILLIASLGSAVYFYKQNKQLIKASAPAQEAAVQALVGKVGKLILLPDEAPTVAPIDDPKLLKDQPFFANSKAGDQVLFFPVAHKVIIYDPSANKIVDVGFFNVSKSEAADAPADDESSKSDSTDTTSEDN